MLVSNFNTSDNKTDAELLLLWKQTSDINFLAKLFERYMHLIYGVAFKYLKNKQDSEDMVMQLFEKLHKDVSKYEIKDFQKWIYVATKNFCLMKLRKGRFDFDSERVQIEQDSVEFDSFLHPDEVNTYSEEKLEALEKCLDKLNNEQKLCVSLFYLKKKSYREINHELHLEMKAVKSAIQNGKRNLKNCIEGTIEEI